MLLILHDLAALGLLGTLSFQAIAMGNATLPHKPSFLTRYRSFDVSGLSGIIAALLVIVVSLGGILYPYYRVTLRPYLESHDLRLINGAFEIKEHFAALAILMLPAYWAAWRNWEAPGQATARRALTWMLTAMVWWNFAVGHVLNYATSVPA